MRIFNLKTITAALIFSATFAQAQSNAPDRYKTYYGQPVAFGSGQAKAFVTVLKDNDARANHKVPQQIGVEFPLSAFTGLPTTGEEETFIIDFPNAVRDTPFQYMMLGWNPHGHPPNYFQVPHFDFHFYIQDLDEVMAIDPGPCNGLACDDFAKAIEPVPPQFMPQNYLNVGSVVPYMGNHLVDVTDPVFYGGPFTKTFLYGAYEGKITFYEPMITRAYLEEKPTSETGCTVMKLPPAYAVSGYYPTRQCTVYDQATGNMRVTLDQFVWRDAPAN